MLNRLFGRRSGDNGVITDRLYEAIVAAARRPAFYSAWGVPDTPLGRFEMLSLHMFLLQHRLRGGDAGTREIAQTLIDEFFRDVEHSLRELGIGDAGVPKRMRNLARMFYGRAEAYADALLRRDEDALTDALKRNIRPGGESWPEAPDLARYVADANADLAEQDLAGICAGRLDFAALRPLNHRDELGAG